MRKSIWIAMLFSFTMLTVLLSACNSETGVEVPQSPVPAGETELKAPQEGLAQIEDGQAEDEKVPYPKFWVEDVPRIDEQGAIVVEIVPLNPNNPGHTLDFSVSLNTHSVDLSMDLSSLATIETDTGYTIQATRWDAPQGGHHVRGVLSFPAGVDGYPLLEGATKMTIRLIALDAPERIFSWER